MSLDCRIQGLWGTLGVAGDEQVGSSMDDLSLGSWWLAWAASDRQATTPDNVELNPLSGMRFVEINPRCCSIQKPDSCCRSINPNSASVSPRFDVASPLQPRILPISKKKKKEKQSQYPRPHPTDARHNQ